MPLRTLWIGLALVLMAGLASAADKPAAKPSKPTPAATNAPSKQVIIAFYFHGTVRCVECLKIERQAREVFEQRFKAELAAKRLVFNPVNTDLPENAHFLQDYKLPCPSLVLVRRNGGKDEKWKLLGETWQLAEDAAKFNRYVQDEVDKLLDAPK